MAERRQEDYDRDFTAMISGLHMEGPSADPPPPAADEPPDLRPDPGVRFTDPFETFNLSGALEEVEPDEPDPTEYTPAPLPPIRRPRGLVAVAWACAGYVLVAMLATIFGVRLPGWAGWLAVGAFVAAIIIGWRSLPKNRDPSDGDGAVV